MVLIALLNGVSLQSLLIHARSLPSFHNISMLTCPLSPHLVILSFIVCHSSSNVSASHCLVQASKSHHGGLLAQSPRVLFCIMGDINPGSQANALILINSPLSNFMFYHPLIEHPQDPIPCMLSGLPRYVNSRDLQCLFFLLSRPSISLAKLCSNLTIAMGLVAK